MCVVANLHIYSYLNVYVQNCAKINLRTYFAIDQERSYKKAFLMDLLTMMIISISSLIITNLRDIKEHIKL